MGRDRRPRALPLHARSGACGRPGRCRTRSGSSASSSSSPPSSRSSRSSRCPATTADGVLDAVVCVILMTALVVILDRILRRTAVTRAVARRRAERVPDHRHVLREPVRRAWTRSRPGPFFAAGEAANARSFQYFSYTTLTTLGYGDYTAAVFPGRSIATFEALVGQVFLAVLVARLVASFTTAPVGRGSAPRSTRRAPPARTRRATERFDRSGGDPAVDATTSAILRDSAS